MTHQYRRRNRSESHVTLRPTSRSVDAEFTRGVTYHHERQVPRLRPDPDRQAAGQEPGPARPDPAARATRPGAPLVDGTVVVGGTGRLAESLPGVLDLLGIASTTTRPTRRQKYAGLVFDATGLTDASQLGALRDWFTPLLRSLADLPAGGRARHPARADHGQRAGRAARARGLHPLARQGGRPRRHGPAGLRRREGRGAAVASTLAFLLSPKSAYVSGQVVRVGTHATGRGRGRGLAAPARRQGRAGDRRQPRHRRADRPRPPPRRRHRGRARRPAGGERAAGADGASSTATTSPSTSPPRTRRSGSPTT